MRVVLLLLATVFVQCANGQDFCKQIKKEMSEDTFQRNYFSPYNEKKLPSVRVTRSLDNNPENDGYDNFFLILRVVGGPVDALYTKGANGKAVEKTEKNMVVEFSDKSVLVSDTVAINHDITDDKAEAIRTIFFPINKATIKDFTTKKIVKFSLAGYERTFSADSANAVMHYIQCMHAAAKLPD